MEVIDTQIHEPVPWQDWETLDTATACRLSTDLALATMDAAGVDAAVIDDLHHEWLEYATTTFPHRLARVDSTHHSIDATSPQVADVVARAATRENTVAIRVFVNHAKPQARLANGGYDEFLRACEALGMPVMVFVGAHAELIELIARSWPSLPLIVDHLGLEQPAFGQVLTQPPFARVTEVLALAKYEQVSIKLSGAPTLSTMGYPFDDVRPTIMQFVEAFGADRLMWGSDIQRVMQRVSWRPAAPFGHTYVGKHTYAEAVGFIEHASWLSAAEKASILGGTARRILQWPRVPASS